MKTRSKFLEPLQRFHLFIHTDTRLKGKPVLGIGSQAAIIILTIVISTYIF